MKEKKICFIMLFFAIFILLNNVKSYAGTQKWKSLNYDVTLNSDGSMDVVETWNISISETNTLFKDFEVDVSKYTDITNVEVSEVKDGEEIFLEEIYEEQYHVKSGCFYALPIESGSKFEIAWNVGLDNSSDTKTYKIYYTVQDAVKVYQDCTELYWQFLGTENEISGKNITGTIKLPQKVSNIEKLRVWAHGDLTGEIKRTDRDLVTFSLPNLSSRSMLEVRIVTEENIYENCINIKNTNKLNFILDEEQKWAYEANLERQAQKCVFFGIIAINILILLFFIKKIIKYRKIGKELKEKYNKGEIIKYFREIPDEKNATPARAMYLYKFSNYKSVFSSKEISRIFSATILDLSLKELIYFEPIDKNDIKIVKNNSKQSIDLSIDENAVYKLLIDAIGDENYITTKEFEKYAKKNYKEVYKSLNNVNDVAKNYHNDVGNFDEEKKEISTKLQKKKNLYVILFGISIFLFPISSFLPSIYIGLIACIFVNSQNINKFSILSEKGQFEQQGWKGLENYMSDYSLLKEKLVPDIALWEKYLVYATVFGISKNVIQQLKIVHPEMFEDTNNDAIRSYTYWHIINNSNYGIDYFSNFSNNLEHAYHNAQVAYSSSSSGSGSGGGFSGGGGGRRRRRRLRRTLINCTQNFIKFT